MTATNQQEERNKHVPLLDLCRHGHESLFDIGGTLRGGLQERDL